jgi:hypothetical protein
MCSDYKNTKSAIIPELMAGSWWCQQIDSKKSQFWHQVMVSSLMALHEI